MKLKIASILLGTVIMSAALTAAFLDIATDRGYSQGYSDCNTHFKQLLLDEGYAEYDKKTAEWHLLDPTTIQGNFIIPSRRVMYTTLDDQIQSFQEELIVLKKQKEALSKKQPLAKLDMKKF